MLRNLWDIREKRDMSLRTVALLPGVPKSTINNIEIW